MMESIANKLLLVALFLLPWQSQAIFTYATVAAERSQYGTFSLYVTEVFILLALLLRGRPQVHPLLVPVVQALYFFFAAAFFSLSFAQTDSVGWFFLLHLLSAGGLFILLNDTRTQLRRALMSFLAGLVVPAVIAWEQVLSGTSIASSFLGMSARDVQTLGDAVVETASGRTLRAYGTFPHPNIFGGYLAVATLVLLYLARQVTSRRGQALMILVATGLGSTLIISFSRSAWLGLCMGVLVLGGIYFLKKQRPFRQTIMVGVVGLFSILITTGVFWPQTIARSLPTAVIETNSLQERASQYDSWDTVFLSRPLFGVGPAGYTFALAQGDPGSQVWAYQPIHNTPLLLLAELGVVGALAFGVFVYRADTLAHRRWRSFGGRLALALGTLVLVISLFDHYLWSLWPGLALSALSFALYLRWSTEDL